MLLRISSRKNFLRILKSSFFSEMLDFACKNALRQSLMTYLIGQTSGRSRIQSRANGLNLSAFFLYWPNHTLSFEDLEKKIDESCLLNYQKNELKDSFSSIRDSWKTEIYKTIKSIAKNYEDQDEPGPSSSQNEAPIVICGRIISSDLPKGARLNVEDELNRYTRITASEFASCKSILFQNTSRKNYLHVYYIFKTLSSQ